MNYQPFNLMLTQISFIRHGEVHNPKDILYGRLPRYALNVNGRNQALRTGRKLKDSKIAGIYTSPMLRARQTTREILRFHPHLTPHQSMLINEVYTPFEGQTGEMLRQRQGDFYSGIDGSYEQPQDILKRAQIFIRRLRIKLTGEHVLAVTHGDIILFVILWALGFAVTPENKLRFKELGTIDAYPEHASITTLSYQTSHIKEHPKVVYWRPKTGEVLHLN